MYFPYLRGRQFELIAIRELLENNLISDKIIPIIEPVRASSTLLKTIVQCKNANQPLAFIINPQVGSYLMEIKGSESEKQELEDAIKGSTIKACIVDHDIANQVKNLSIKDTLFVVNKKDYIDLYLKTIQDEKAKFNLIPDERDFRRKIVEPKILLSDPFDTKERNSDYSDTPEFFSDDHLYFSTDGYRGFSDYSIVGNKFSEAGFAPYCVVIHIVYFDESKRLMIRHFKSRSNEDATDPAKKFKEALESLLDWNETQKLDTYAMKQFQMLYESGSYPGLGTIKKLSIMHHIELINNFFNKKA